MNTSVSNSWPLSGRTALVTGSSRGIGWGIARSLARAGATVVLHGHNADRLEEAARQLRDEGHVVHAVRGTLDDAAAAAEVGAHVLAAVGTPDVVVTNAGGSSIRPCPLEQIAPEEWEAEIASNLTSTFLTLRSFVPAMKERGSGSVITVSSTATRIAHAHAHAQSPPAYTAAKAAVEMLTRAWPSRPGRTASGPTAWPPRPC